MKVNNLLVLVIIVLLAWILASKLSRKNVERLEIVRIDTVEIVKPKERIIVKRAKPKIIYLRDTIVESKPYVAVLDTIVQKDSIQVNYFFPENQMDLKILPSSDTIRVPKIIYSKEQKKNAWMDYVVPTIVGIAFGYILGKAK